MLFGKVYKLVNIRLNGFYATLHGGYCIALTLQSYTLPPYSSELLHGSSGSSTSMMAMKVASKDEHFIILQ